MDKKQLRKAYLENRIALSVEEVAEMSEKICAHFSMFPLHNARYIHIFYPIPEKKEVDALKLSSWLRQSHPEIKLVLSKMNSDDHSLSHVVWKTDSQLSKNKWGITEPLDGEVVSREKLDMILIPLLAYDLKGNRVGYGKGYYDRFLAECRPGALKIGLSFFPPENSIGDADQHDVPLDICITPEKIWRFNQ